MKYQIEQINNGWVVSWEEPMIDEPDKMRTHKEGFTYNDYATDEDVMEVFIRMLWFLNEEIGVPHNKHREKNININLE